MSNQTSSGRRNDPASTPTDASPSVRPPSFGVATVLRSADNVRVPLYRAGRADQGVTSDDLLQTAGVTRTRPLTVDEVRALVKVPTDLSLVMPELIALLRQEPTLFSSGKVTPELVEQSLASVAYLAPRARAFAEASALLDDQLALASSDLGDLAFRVRRRVMAQADEDPAILQRWEKVLRYLDRLVPGPRTPHTQPKTPDDK